ncbi:MAG: hypothetical protein IPM07_28820 [Anaerolineales bacterium]|nr:hypothetical protein [Anaerolineales bacterium]
MTRRELLPDEADHPRANDYYYRIDIGPLQRLERPVRATTFRRLTFIHTTVDRLLAAEDVKELFQVDDPFEQLWSALREHNLRPLKNRLTGDRPVRYYATRARRLFGHHLSRRTNHSRVTPASPHRTLGVSPSP